MHAYPGRIPNDGVESGARHGVGKVHGEREGKCTAIGEASPFGAQRGGSSAQTRRLRARVGFGRGASAEQVASPHCPEQVATMRVDRGKLTVEAVESDAPLLAIELPDE
jgi:hypothetical protein